MSSPYTSKDNSRSPGPSFIKRAFRVFSIILLVLLFVVSAAAAGTLFVVKDLFGQIGLNNPFVDEAKKSLDAPLEGQARNILVMGVDAGEGPKRSDTLILVRLDFKARSISTLSLPRDLLVKIQGHGEDKINSAYALGGAPLTIATVKQEIGLPIHHFVEVNLDGFTEMVNALGGIYYDVDQRYFNDNSRVDLTGAYEPIDIDPGYQKLSGQDALAFVRYRHNDNDFVRIARQQTFLTEVNRQALRFANVSKLPELAMLFAGNTSSDIGLENATNFGRLLLLSLIHI